MNISADQQAESRRRYAEYERDVDEDRIKRVLSRFARKIDRLGIRPPASLAGVWGDIRLMRDLLRDYTRGEYTAVPWKMITSVTGAVIYFVTPFDAVFDYIPVAGFVDDAMIIKLALDLARDDLTRYARWKRQVETTAADPEAAED